MHVNGRLERDQRFKNQKLGKTRDRRQRLGAERAESERSCRNDLLPELAIRTAALSELRPSPRRVRKSSDAQIGRLIASIKDLGFAVPILIRDSEIIDGHVRVEAARRLGLEHVPAIEVTHLSASEIRKLRLALNRTAELGEWDLDQLRIEIADLVELDVDLSATGFSPQELDIILLDDCGEQDAPSDDQAIDVPDEPVSKPSDIWQLGDHRITCGNALEADVYDRLLDGEQAHAVLTDMPYNVKIKGNVSGLGKKLHGEFAMASGEMDDAAWQDFLNTALTRLAAPLVDGAVLFAFMDWRSIHRLYEAGFFAGLNLINLAIWYKRAGAMGTLYRSAHELVAVFCKGKTPRINNVELGRHGRNRDNVWCAPGANRQGSSAAAMLAFHATPKPVPLCVDAILDVTKRDDIVLDAFLGSGTTLIAAEKTGRRCFGIEIEPKFVDVAIRRWEQLTSKQAVLTETGEAFADVASRRAGEREARHD